WVGVGAVNALGNTPWRPGFRGSEGRVRGTFKHLLSLSRRPSMRPTLLPALLLSLLPVAAGAQAHPLVGTWEVIYPIGFEIDGPDQRARAIDATGTLTVTATDDSLIAVLVTPPREGFPTRPPSRFTTPRTDVWPVRFEQRSPATI